MKEVLNLILLIDGVLSVTFAVYQPLYQSYPALTYVATYRSDTALPLLGGGTGTSAIAKRFSAAWLLGSDLNKRDHLYGLKPIDHSAIVLL